MATSEKNQTFPAFDDRQFSPPQRGHVIITQDTMLVIRGAE
jgi:hypothetical protein